jgi:hypothetical protein
MVLVYNFKVTFLYLFYKATPGLGGGGGSLYYSTIALSKEIYGSY